MADSTEPGPNRRKVRDRSVALLLVGTALLMPPLVGVSLIEGRLGGMPIPLVYVSVVWVALIAGAAALAHPLQNSENTAPPGNANDAAG